MWPLKSKNCLSALNALEDLKLKSPDSLKPLQLWNIAEERLDLIAVPDQDFENADIEMRIQMAKHLQGLPFLLWLLVRCKNTEHHAYKLQRINQSCLSQRSSLLLHGPTGSISRTAVAVCRKYSANAETQYGLRYAQQAIIFTVLDIISMWCSLMGWSMLSWRHRSGMQACEHNFRKPFQRVQANEGHTRISSSCGWTIIRGLCGERFLQR